MEVSMDHITDYEEVFVVFIFSDDTRQVVRTSMNQEVLRSFGVKPMMDSLFDLDRLRTVPFRRDAESVMVYDERPVFDTEVLRFASRFI